MQKLLELIGLVGKSSDDIMRSIKLVFFVGVLMGAYYLAIYIHAQGLAIPINIGSLAMLVLIFGITAAIIVAVVAFYIIAGASTLRNAFGERFADLLNTSSTGIFVPSMQQQLRILFVIFVLPQAIAAALLFDWWNWTPWRWGYVIVGGHLLPMLYACLRIRRREHRALQEVREGKSKRLFKSYVVTIASLYVLNSMSAGCGFIFMVLLNARGLLTSRTIFLWSALFVIVINTIAVTSRIVLRNGSASSNIAPSESVATSSSIYRSNAPFASFALIVASLFPVVAEQVSAATLNLLGLGGGETRVLYSSGEDKLSLPPALIDHCDKSYKVCTSKPVEVFLDAGEVMFVRLLTASPKTMYRIRAGDLSESWEHR